MAAVLGPTGKTVRSQVVLIIPAAEVYQAAAAQTRPISPPGTLLDMILNSARSNSTKVMTRVVKIATRALLILRAEWQNTGEER